jgi:hypothetical protein
MARGMPPKQLALMIRAAEWMAERKDLPRSASIGDAMLLLRPLELPPLGEPVPSENRHERRARMKRERQHAKGSASR